MTKKTKRFSYLLAVVAVFVFSFSFSFFIIYACACGPVIEFISPTPNDASSQSTNGIEIKLSTYDSAEGHYVLTNFDDSLLGWWRFENNANDSAGTSDGIWNGTESYDTGKFGASGVFNGTDNYIDVNLPSVVNSSFTISAWIYLNEITWSGAIVSDDVGEAGHLLQIGGSDLWQFDDTYGEAAAETDVWTHVVGVYDSSNHTETLYVNGQYVSSANSDRTISQNINIGRRKDGFYIDGKIDEVVILKRALGSGEVLSLYDGTANQYGHVFSDLATGNHTFTGYIVDKIGNKVATEDRTIIITPTEDIPSNSNNSRTSTGSFIHYGCKDPSAINYEYFAGSNPALCKYDIRATQVYSVTPNIIQPISRTLKLKMVGDDVKSLQVYLNTHGYPVSISDSGSNGNESNFFGPKTKSAVILFQKANSPLVSDGIVGPKTRAILNK